MIRPKGSTDAQRDKKVSFSIRENKVNINLGAFTDDTSGNIRVDASAVLDDPPGKKVAGSNDNAEFAQNGYKITAALTDGTALATTARADVNKNAGTDGDILNADVADGTVVVLTITPKDSTNTLLADSAVQKTITVTA